jgi:hypothetical protein
VAGREGVFGVGEDEALIKVSMIITIALIGREESVLR